MMIRFRLLVLLLLLAPALAQAQDDPGARPPAGIPLQQSTAGQGADAAASAQEKKGRDLLAQMLAALGGDLWLNRSGAQMIGHTASFFKNQPTGAVIDFIDLRRYPGSGQPEAERLEFKQEREFFHGKITGFAQLYTANQGYEISDRFGAKPLPADQVGEYMRRRAHSIEAVYAYWLKTPGVVVVYEGATMVGRRPAEKVTVLSAANDAVTIEMDAATHLPLRRTFQWKNPKYEGHDEEVEDYEDYHTLGGLPTALTVTRYHNGDMSNQRFFTKVTYNPALAPTLFDPAYKPTKP